MEALKSCQREDANQTKDGYDFGDIRTKRNESFLCLSQEALSKTFLKSFIMYSLGVSIFYHKSASTFCLRSVSGNTNLQNMEPRILMPRNKLNTLI